MVGQEAGPCWSERRNSVDELHWLVAVGDSLLALERAWTGKYGLHSACKSELLLMNISVAGSSPLAS
jgi:hypothetical protein